MSYNKYKTRSGQDRWEVNLRYKDFDGKVCKKHKMGFKMKREAKEWEEQFLAKYQGTPEITFAELYQEYVDDVLDRMEREALTIKGSTLRIKEANAKNHLLPTFGDMRVSDITVDDVKEWKKEMLCKKSSTTNKAFNHDTLVKIHALLVQILNYGMEHHNLEYNVAQMAKGFSHSDGRKSREKIDLYANDYWDYEEYCLFREEVKKDDRKYLFYLFETLYFSGCRIGEALGIRVKDLNFHNNTLRLEENASGVAAHRGKDGSIEYESIYGTLKTGESRVFPMPQFYMDEMKEYLSHLYGYNPDSHIFPVGKRHVQKMLDKMIERVNTHDYLRRMTLHGFRHAHITLLISKGYTVQAVAQRAGHKQESMTLMYSGLFRKDAEAIAEGLNNLELGIK